jgi:hypothetical protein
MRAAVKARLQEKLPQVQRRSGLTFDLIANTVTRKKP